ncbi:MAG: HAD hydrolase family protein [Vicinamibacterales bacterium]
MVRDGMVTGGGVVAIVPARGGSKSLPRKNIRSLGGVPLLSYSISAGLSARTVDRVIVSTDDQEIATLAREAGAEVPFLRPAALADDSTRDLPVFEHALEWLERHEGHVPEIVVQLRPTSPLRPPDCVDRAIDLLRGDPTADSVRAVVRASQHPYKMWTLQPDGGMAPLLDGAGPEPFNRPRQELPAAYWQTGHVDAIRTSTIRDKASMTGGRVLALVIDGAYACDIDTEADLLEAEWMLGHMNGPLIRPAARGRLPERLRLVVFDFDGVMTDNRVWVADDGAESVVCDRGDGLGLSMLRTLGVETLVLSTERNPVVGARCRKLDLPFCQGVPDKADHLRRLLVERRIAPCQVVYVGNDVNDLACMQMVGCSVAVADAHPAVRRVADIILTRVGGRGAVRELCDRIASHLGAVDVDLSTRDVFTLDSRSSHTV